MADVREKVEAEFENIERVLQRLPASGRCCDLSDLELAGVATLLQGFYNGLENVLKQVALSKGIDIPRGESWPRDLINTLVERELLAQGTADELRRYLAFRHFISHAYAVELHADRIEPLAAAANAVFVAVRADIVKALGKAQ